MSSIRPQQRQHHQTNLMQYMQVCVCCECEWPQPKRKTQNVFALAIIENVETIQIATGRLSSS